MIALDRTEPPDGFARLAAALAFDPRDGTIVRRPRGAGYGYWVGGHKVSYREGADGSGRFVLFYRERSPLEHGRGGRCAVAVSDDGETFDDVWEASKVDLAATSIEVGHAVPVGDRWHLYVSYEFAPTPGLWRIDLLEADDPSGFDTQHRRTVLSPGDYGLGWIKDPWVRLVDGKVRLFAAAPARRGPKLVGDRVEAAPLDATVLAVSDDGRYFPEIEYVFEAPADDRWDGRRARLNGAFPLDDGSWFATFDGGRTFYDNYEEACGVAWSPDGMRFVRLRTPTPWLEPVDRSGVGRVRYVDVVRVGDTLHWFYEHTRPDGAHELRTLAVDVSTVDLHIGGPDGDEAVGSGR